MARTNLVNPWATKNENFKRNVKAGITMQGKTYKDLARKADISEPTVYTRYNNPETMTVKEFRAFIEVAKLSEDKVLDLLMRNR